MLYKKIIYIFSLFFICKLCVCFNAVDKRIIEDSNDPFFVVVITSYKNEKFCEKNLKSVFKQDYKNFRIIYINDCSPDKTFEKVESIIKKYKDSGLNINIELINNAHRRRKMANMYDAIHSCKNNEIIFELDGDDLLPNKSVLSYLAEIYKDSNVWATYGQFQRINGSIGFCKEYPKYIIANNKFRSHPGIASAPRTFYAGIFKLIKKEDLMLENNFIMSAADIAYWTPILEMTSLGHFKFISKVLYIYNDHTGNNDHTTLAHAKLQYECSRVIYKKSVYAPIVSREQFL